MGVDKCHKPKAEDQVSMAGMPTSAKSMPLNSDLKGATLPELESIFETIQRINRLERPLRHGKQD